MPLRRFRFSKGTMSTPAQIAANQQNAKHSTGAKTEAGKAKSSRNNFRHGFTAAFCILPGEDREEFNELVADLLEEHQPETATEALLVKKMAQHHWLVQRAILLQEALGKMKASVEDEQRAFALYLRYQTTNDRAFHKCLDQLLKIRAERRKSEIGFESQRLKQAEQERSASVEKRKQELHKYDLMVAEMKADRDAYQPRSRKRMENVDLRPENDPFLEEIAA